MFRHILVLVDRQSACAGAAQHAYDLARALGGRVTLLHVLEAETATARTAAHLLLERLSAGARRAPAQVVLPITDHDLQGAVAEFARRTAADLIVVPMTGGGGLLDEATGRFAAALARRSGLPVHLAGGGRRLAQAVPSRWQRVLDQGGPSLLG